MNSQRIVYTSVLFISVLVLINIVSSEYFLRIDFTADQQYTLSSATRDLLKNLDEPVTVKAYFSENLPPDIAKTKKDFRELLVEYNALSGGNIAFEFVNPNEDEKIETEAMQSGIQPVLINVRDKDQVKQQKAYLGAVIKKADQKDAIPFMQPGGAMEYALTTSIKKIAQKEKIAVGLLQGHGEPTLADMTQVYQGLSVLYDVQEILINNGEDIPAIIKTLAIVAPKDSLPLEVFSALDRFLARGGNLLIALNRVEGDFTTAMGRSVSTLLETWLYSKGIDIQPSFVLDVNCGAVTVQQQQGYFVFNNQISFPYLPVINSFSDHPSVKGLESVVLKFASPIRFFGDSTARFTPLLFTSDKSALQPTPLYFDINRKWQDSDFTSESLVLGGVLEGTFGGSIAAKIVVFSDGDFAVNGERSQSQQLQPDNVSLFVNSVDWLSDDTGLIDLRTKGVTSRPLKKLDDQTQASLKYSNFLAPILLALIYGFWRAQQRKRRRIQRMLEQW